MGNLTKELLKNSKTVDAIYHYHEKKNESDHVTSSIPASKLGGPCDRQLWYIFRHCSQPRFGGRILRLFETGNLQEERFVEELRGIGCEVHDVGEDGGQFLVTALGGHVRGYLDGCVIGLPEAPKTWHVCEYKTHNAKSFRALIKKGVTEHKKDHFAQMQIYMHLTGMTRALYLAVNKDTDELYSERIKYNKQYAEELIERAQSIMSSNAPPERISYKPDFYQCRWCEMSNLCFGFADESLAALQVDVISCRQCCHSTPEIGSEDDKYGRWKCEKHCRALSLNDQLKACEDHLTLPALLPFTKPLDYGTGEDGKEFIHFEDPVYGEWYHGNGYGSFTSKELLKTPPNVLCNRLVTAAKQLFDGEVTGAAKDPLVEAEWATAWKGRASKLAVEWDNLYQENLFHQTPIKKTELPTHVVNEYSYGRMAILYPAEGEAEIRFDALQFNERKEHA